MAAIRVMIGDMSPLLRSLVEGVLGAESRFELLSDPAVDRLPGQAASPAATDVLVVSEEAMRRIVPFPLGLGAHRDFGMVAISPDGLDAAVVRLSAHRRRIDVQHRQTLAEAILDAAGAHPEAH